MTKEETFYIEEYKLLRQEITTKLKDRLDFNRWGLIALAALYSYIFSSNPAKPILFWVPVFLSAAMIAYLNEEHRMVAVAGAYIKGQVEPWISGLRSFPQGWETFLASTKSPRWWSLRRWPLHLWDWSPVPMWIVVLSFTLIIAILASAGLWRP